MGCGFQRCGCDNGFTEFNQSRWGMPSVHGLLPHACFAFQDMAELRAKEAVARSVFANTKGRGGWVDGRVGA